MKRKMDNSGFAMVEAMVVVMMFTLLASTLYGIAGMRHKMAIRRIQEDEAYYAAVSAVRLMAAELAEDGLEEDFYDGMEPFNTEITFVPDDLEADEVSIPVEIRADRSGDELLLAANVKYGTGEKQATLLLRLEETVTEVIEDPKVVDEKVSSSNAHLEYESRWVPLYY